MVRNSVTVSHYTHHEIRGGTFVNIFLATFLSLTFHSQRVSDCHVNQDVDLEVCHTLLCMRQPIYNLLHPSSSVFLSPFSVSSPFLIVLDVDFLDGNKAQGLS